jgi:hypothetical protein
LAGNYLRGQSAAQLVFAADNGSQVTCRLASDHELLENCFSVGCRTERDRVGSARHENQTESMSSPLTWPSHFPPRGRKLFFIGVRGLGPDLSFFSDLRREQASRSRDVLAMWSADVRRKKIARSLSAFLHLYVRWPGRYFRPDDQLAVCLYGPEFLEIDNWSTEDFIDIATDRYGVVIDHTVLSWHSGITLGEIVDELASRTPPDWKRVKPRPFWRKRGA